MKNFYSKLIAVIVLILTSSVYAQHVFFENRYGTSSENVQAKLEFDKQNYDVFFDSPDEKIYVSKTNESTQRNDLNVNFTVNLVSGGHTGVNVLIYNETGLWSRHVYNGQNSADFNLEPGVYDIFTTFNYYATTRRYVIKEQVNISENSSITINKADATNKIVNEIYNEYGEVLSPATNADYAMANNEILINNYPNILISQSSLWFSGTSEDPVWAYYISDVSDRYTMNFNLFSQASTGIHYFPKYKLLNGISESMTTPNQIDNMVYHEEKPFQSSIIAEESQEEITSGFTVINTFQNFGTFIAFTIIGNEYEPGSRFKSMINPDLNGEITKTLIAPGIIEKSYGSIQFFNKGTAFTLDSQNNIIYGDQSIGLNDYLLNNYLNRTDEGTKYIPFHPKFSFTKHESQGMVYGNNIPIINTAFFSNIFIAGAIGRYGEFRESDFISAEIEVYRDNVSIFAGDYITLTLDPMFNTPNQFEIKIINPNTMVDGVQGKNITQVFFDNNNEDSFPPSLQMLQFRNSDNMITHNFMSGQEGFVRLAASDFNFSGFLVYNYNEGNSVQLFYSLYNQEEWSQLTLTNYPEHFFVPKFGDYYEASLAEIPQPQGNDVWYDVKVICTDAAGNKQTQTISPAFKLNSTLQAEEIHENNDFIVYPNPFNDNLNIQLPKNIKGDYIVKLTDLTGRIISAQNKKSTDSKSLFYSFLPKGTYVLSIESNGKTLAKKVIKK
ncbi:T9SS type A sorting domain-containing protein [Moheibacter sediminis]|uniref:Por secretion system C-terminal sorting domain-containing protein n=1 Tax=Moheibacter sediminis TaxID=1434700 RepID=A0A1W1Y955_9FLAO|nr:T9SS type A sorting domain-containing protein [Moheibacter sediminis]SMC32683.1 Por secretion system C-terminal sorting domain-containing protein [Moheibacter sediminis]